MNTQRISLDLSKRTGNQQIVIAQGDASGTTIVATIYDNGTKLAETGVTAQFLIELPDGKHYVRDNATYNAGVITYVCNESKVASVHGYTDNAYFTLTKGNTIVSTERFAVIVKPCAYDGMEVAESYDSAIQDAIDALDAAVEQMPDMVEDVLEQHPEWTTTVQDGSITQAKLATDLARDRERLQYRLANMLTNALPEGETATASDAAKTPLAGLALYGKSTQAGTPTPSAPVSIESVAANLLPNNVTTHTIAGVTYTVNEDGIISVSGTATATANQDIGRGITMLPAGTYTFGAGTGSGYSLFMYKIVDGTATVLRNSPGTFTLDAETSVFMRIAINSGAVVSGVVSPFIYSGSTVYPFVPYDHAGLWARGRNLWSLGQEYSRTSAGDLFARSAMHVPAGQYTLSFDVVSFTSGSNNNVQLLMYDQSVTVVTQPSVALRTGRVSLAVNPSRDVESLKLYVGTACTLANFQLERGSTATAYQPYESTVTPIDLDGHELRSLPDGTRDELTVGADGHAVLVQRVGYAADLSKLTANGFNASSHYVTLSLSTYGYIGINSQGKERPNTMSSAYAGKMGFAAPCVYVTGNGASLLVGDERFTTTRDDAMAMLAGVSAQWALATPVTIDLGYVDAVPLCGPDLTAQAIPTAPMQLTYERDLNATLARLESAIATLA